MYFGWLEGEVKEGKEDVAMLNDFFMEELRVKHMSIWLLEWGLGRADQRGLDCMSKAIFLGVCSKREQVR